jgi:deoxyadenosine/deoxycytidine kinase
MSDRKYRYIAIEGNIGAGKSTLATMLAERTGALYLPEQFQENPFLRDFYADPDRYGFTVELSFLEERFRNVKQALSEGKPVVADYLWEKSMVFARVNLKGAELQLFERIYQVLAASIPVPDLVIYLHRSYETLHRQITRRGRDFEKGIQPGYLQQIGAGYQQFFARENRMPVLWIHHEMGPEALTAAVLKLMEQTHGKGLHLIAP